jgi:leucyl-tRNA synthetase
MTVLANEQVIDGKGWRSGAPVEKRKLSQWFLKITQFADDLLDGLDTLDQWPDKVKLMQENWIGKSQGLQFSFALADTVVGDIERLEVFTTRPDTIFGASFAAIAADHPISLRVANDNPNWPPSSTSAARPAPPPPRSKRRRSWASTPALGDPPVRPGPSCHCSSRISC